MASLVVECCTHGSDLHKLELMCVEVRMESSFVGSESKGTFFLIAESYQCGH
jgi:hypothetical protein